MAFDRTNEISYNASSQVPDFQKQPTTEHIESYNLQEPTRTEWL